MKALVTYMSQTGNTKKIAEAIYEVLDCEKEIAPIEQVADLGGYDVSFLGFAIRRFGPDPKTVGVIQKLCQPGRDVALFITHAASESEPLLPGWLDGFRQAACDSNIVGMFDCQGELDRKTKRIMLLIPFMGLRGFAKRDNSQGQPDATRVERARAFGREMMKKMAG